MKTLKDEENLRKLKELANTVYEESKMHTFNFTDKTEPVTMKVNEDWDATFHLDEAKDGQIPVTFTYRHEVPREIIEIEIKKEDFHE